MLKTGAQGILLAHHADDQAETVLKRVLGGLALTNLRAMTQVSHIGPLKLFILLLEVKQRFWSICKNVGKTWH